jgi:hypothetical protein
MPEETEQVLDGRLKGRLIALAEALIDVHKAQILVPPMRAASGYWFGGGDIVCGADGAFTIVGRYRNAGDSRTGVAAGARGIELAVFSGERFFGPFEKVRSFSKADLSAGDRVLSIEGASLHWMGDRVELFISSEKDVPYPDAVRSFQKPGTGVWSIDSIVGHRIDDLDPSELTPVLSSDTPATLHVKDPAAFDHPHGGSALIHCTHPYTWASSNSALAIRRPGETQFETIEDNLLPRGFVWDVAVTRITDRLGVPRVGAFRDLPSISLYFYDGAECIREHEQHTKGVWRPRGYSCEEIGGLAWGLDGEFPNLERLSIDQPFFVSPYGTGCNRYVSTLVTGEAVYATWQQSQADRSQPLVGHALPMEEVERILSA